MSEATPTIQPIACSSFVVRGLAPSLASIDSVMETLFLERDFNPTFMMLSSKGKSNDESDYTEFTNLIAEGTNVCYSPHAENQPQFSVYMASHYINQSTGQLISLYPAYHLPVGSIVFGRFTIDGVVE